MLPSACCATYIILLNQCYTISEKTIASPTTLRRLLHHMDHPLDLWCHPLQYVCSPFEIEGKGEGELIAQVAVEMVDEVMVQIVRAVVVHLSRYFLLRSPPPPPILTPYPRCLYPHTLTHHFQYPHTLTHHFSYPQTLTHHLPYPQTLTHLYHICCRQSQRP